MFRLESSHLQLENEIAVEAEMVEERIDVEGLLVHSDRHLTPYEGEATAQFQEEIAQMFNSPRSISRSLDVAVTERKSKL